MDQPTNQEEQRAALKDIVNRLGATTGEKTPESADKVLGLIEDAINLLFPEHAPVEEDNVGGQLHALARKYYEAGGAVAHLNTDFYVSPGRRAGSNSDELSTLAEQINSVVQGNADTMEQLISLASAIATHEAPILQAKMILLRRAGALMPEPDAVEKNHILETARAEVESRFNNLARKFHAAMKAASITENPTLAMLHATAGSLR